jgi:phosphoribosylformimino-5-aminoimidazole carboxamide ribotide isomerase
VRIIPVIDLMGGVVVRGVGGRRAEYRPVRSVLTDSAEPVAVARALLAASGASELYIADLDAIAGEPPAFGVYASVRELGAALWVDAGVRDAGDAKILADAGVDSVVAGLETVRDSEALGAVVNAIGPERVAFSLDLKGGRLLGRADMWGTPASAADRAIKAGVRRLIVLDLERVGEGGGTGTEELCAAIRARHPGIDLIAGGGVRNEDDLRRLELLGVNGTLIASALHDRKLGHDYGRHS